MINLLTDHFLTVFNTVDPQTQELLNKIMNIVFPILYALCGGAAVFVGVRYGFKIHNDPENKGEHIKSMVWAFIGIGIVFLASAIGHIVVANFAGKFS